MARHKHSLSNFRLFTGEMGTLMPYSVLEVLPGDTVQMQTKALVRVTPLAAPIMHQVTARIHHWNVPNRIVADNDGRDWENFITGGPDGQDTSTVPTIQTTGTPNDLLDYMGLPAAAGIAVNAYPVRGFNFCYNEFYRDQDTVTERDQHDVTVPNIAWEKDYFTTARPFSQRGPTITIPVGDRARIAHDANDGATLGIWGTAPGTPEFRTLDSSGPQLQAGDQTQSGVGDMYADLSNAAGTDAIEFRRLFALQRFAEARARFGARYTEYMRYVGSNYKGTLNRPEYLGGGTASLDFSEVLQTAPEINQENEREFGVGDLYGHGISSMRSNKFRRTIDEHGFIISMLSVRPKAVYTNGIERFWLKETREDFFQKELELIGQQEILDNELFAQAGQADAVFGFQDRYSEYKFARNGVAAEFRSTLDYWHMARQFESQPVLNQSFTDCVPTKRIYNEQTQHPLWIMARNSTVARRVVGSATHSRLL